MSPWQPCRVGEIAIVKSESTLGKHLNGKVVIMISAKSSLSEALGVVDVIIPSGEVRAAWIEELIPLSWGRLVKLW